MIINKFDRREDILDLCNDIFTLVRNKNTNDVFIPNDDFLIVQNIKKHVISLNLDEFTDDFYIASIETLKEITSKYQ